MSGRGVMGPGANLEEAAKFLDRMKAQREECQTALLRLENEKRVVDEQIDALRRKQDVFNEKINEQKDNLDRLERSVAHADATYKKLVESSQSLVDFMRKEYQDVRRASHTD